ncbi:EpsG family protein [Geobacter sp.]|uniref:EpsG family protein n=1 Tax=Geobacter sp. TaxID=46610 RepID=UPI00260D67A4|nr:EpsG family protein [Geobacter sp.]
MNDTTEKNVAAPRELPLWTNYVDWLLLSLIVFVFAFYQILGESRDWQSYDDFFELLRVEGTDSLGISRFEPGFVIVGLILTKLLSANLAVYGMIAASVMFCKCWVINQFSANRIIFFIVTLFYFIHFVPLHELTQLRVACSATFLLLAFVLLGRNNRLVGLAACAVALAFHLSAIVVSPFLFIKSSSRRTVILVSVIVFIATLFGVGQVTSYFQDSIGVVKMYQEAGFGDQIPNPLSSAMLLDWGMIVAGLFIWDRLSLSMKHVILLELVGMAIFYASMDFAVISHRIRELLSVFWIFFVAEGLQQELLVKQISILFVITSLILYSYLFVFSGQFFI